MNSQLTLRIAGWSDHSRDLLHLINTFASEMPRPIIGLGHSMGCAQLVNLSLFHPRLFHTLILIDPAILPEAPGTTNAALMSSLRTERWSTREDAEQSLRPHRVFRGWDKEALELYFQHGLRSGPTAIHPDIKDREVSLKTSKHQEAWMYVRPIFNPPHPKTDRLLYPDLSHDDLPQTFSPTMTQKNPQISLLFHRAQSTAIFGDLPRIRPSVLYLFGGASYLLSPRVRQEQIQSTGTGLGGSGGERLGMVKAKVWDRGGHMLPVQEGKIHEVAQASNEWLEEQLLRFDEDEKFLANWDSKKSETRGSGLVLSKTWMEMVKKPTQTLRNGLQSSKL